MRIGLSNMTETAPQFTKTEHLDGRVVLYGGDNRDVLKSLPDCSIDSIVTDPPYALVSIQKRFGMPGSAPIKVDDATSASNDLKAAYARASAGFMGKQWDTGEVAFSEVFWAECLRVLKPGGHVVAFSGTRTYHRMAVAIEDAGFEIRDQLAWCYFSGFPKGHDVSKAIDKAAGKAEERGYIEATGGLAGGSGNTVGTFKGRQLSDDPVTDEAKQWRGWNTALKPAWEPICLSRKPPIGTVVENVLSYGTGALNIDACRIGDSGATTTIPGDKRNTTVHALGDGLGAQGGSIARLDKGMWPANILTDGSEELLAVCGHAAENVSRLYFSAKADKLDRIGSKHPTVKPVDLMQWLCRLITPPGGVVLDPFAGSGSTGEAAWREGMRCILIEREEEYQADIAERLRLANAGPATRKARAVKQVANDNLPLFGGVEATGGGQRGEGRQIYGHFADQDRHGGIMAGKGGFGFRIREHRARTAN